MREMLCRMGFIQPMYGENVMAKEDSPADTQRSEGIDALQLLRVVGGIISAILIFWIILRYILRVI